MSVTDDIKERLDIVDVISNYVPLKKAGRSYKGLCPFHSEKTPSFVVFPDSQSWHCFGACGTGGDVFNFVMKRENLDFAEALKLLAAKAGVELQPREGPLPAEEQRLERLREIVSVAAGYFHYLLINAGEAIIARRYLEQRGLTPATWESWQLGYALDSWDALKGHLLSKNFALDEIEIAGLVIRRDDESATGDRGVYDRFRGRLIIPIRDGQGRTIGFGGRVLKEDKERPQPKYINSPETPLFDKGSVVYGLDMARKAIRDADLAVLVEGYMDVLMSHQVGVQNVVAGMGTALTEAQLRQISRYSHNITLALDPDVAGDHATLRGLETARQALERTWEPVVDPRGLVRQESRLKAQLRIAAMPDGLDPDELARADVGRWRQVIAQARPIVDYYLAVVSHEEDLSTAHGKANAVNRMAPLVLEIANPVEREHYVQALARLVRADERLVAEQLAAAARAARPGQRSQTRPLNSPGRADGVANAPDPASNAAEGQGDRAPQRAAVVRGAGAGSFGLEEHLIGLLLTRPDLLLRLDDELVKATSAPLSVEDFATAENREIAGMLQAVIASLPSAPLPDDPVMDEVLAALPDVLRGRALTIVEWQGRGPIMTDEKLAKDVVDSLLRLRAKNLERETRRLHYLIVDSQESGPSSEWRHYSDLLDQYKAQKLAVWKLLNARTMMGAISQAANKATKDKDA